MAAELSDPAAGRFRAGDRVRVLDEARGGNPRTPRYLWGWTGTVVRAYGIVENRLDHHDPDPPLYSVLFRLPDGRERSDEVVADVHEDWLAAARRSPPPSAARVRARRATR